MNTTLGEFRRLTENLPDDACLVIMSTVTGDTHVIEDISVNRYAPVIYIETGNI